MDNQPPSGEEHIQNALKPCEEQSPINSINQDIISISCLPDELLVLVFDILRWLWFHHPCYIYDRGTFTRQGYPRARWIAEATHVCQHWRAIALASPHLWSCLCLSNLECAREMISRSQSAPLTVVYGRQMKRAFKDQRMSELEEDILQVVLSHLPRIQVLDLDQLDHYNTGKLFAEHPPPAPLLETLKLATFTIPGLRRPQRGFYLPSGIFPAAMPRLRRLQTVGCRMVMPLPWFENATHLSFANLEWGGGPRLTVDRLLEIVGVATGLQELSVVNCLWGSPAGPQVVGPSSLIKVVIEGESPVCIQLLEQLILPAATSLTVVCLELFGLEDFLHLGELVMRYFFELGNPARSLSIEIKLVLTMMDVCQMALIVCGPNDSFDIDLTISPGAFFSSFFAFPSMSSSPIEFLYIDPQSPHEKELQDYWQGPEWLNAVQVLAHLRSVRVSCTPLAKTLLSALADDHGSSADSLLQTALFPNLRRLALIEVDVMAIEHLLLPALLPRAASVTGDDRFVLDLGTCDAYRPQIIDELVHAGVHVEAEFMQRTGENTAPDDE